MSQHKNDIAKAGRLRVIAQRIGFALWQLQELERVAAQYYVMLAKASPGMGVDAGQELLDEVLSKPFGRTVNGLMKSGQVPGELMDRLQALLGERNWMVYNSRSTSRSAVHDEAVCGQLIIRIDAIADEALVLLKEVLKVVETFMLSKGFSPQDIKLAALQAQQRVSGDNAI